MITSVFPSSAPVGERIVIRGTHFSANPSENIVYFGTVRAEVLEASPDQLAAAVPVGAVCAPISVTTALARTAVSPGLFTTTFGVGGELDAAAFARQAGLAAGPSPAAVVLADLDGDGRLDLAVANGGTGSVWVLRNAGHPGELGTNGFAAPAIYPVGALPLNLVAADVDGDGRLDLVTANWAAGSVSVLRNGSSAGNVSFLPVVMVPVGASSTRHTGLAVRDLDGDGRPEVILSNSGTNTISVLQNLSGPGAVAFAAPLELESGTSEASRLTAGDLDGDGRPDLILTRTTGSARLTILRNVASPGPLTKSSFEPGFDLSTPSGPRDVLVGDLDGDGRLDLAACSAASKVSVWRNLAVPGSLGTNSLAPRVDYSIAPSVPWTMGLADLDGDGRADLFTANYTSDYLAVLRNAATPGNLDTNSFAPWVGLATTPEPFWMASGDVDGDGRPDLVSAHNGSTTVDLLRNVLPPVCVAPPAGLTAWFRAENNALDAAGTNHGALLPGADFAPGVAGKAFRFDGLEGALAVPNSPAWLFHAKDFTVELWANPEQTNEFVLFHQATEEGTGLDWSYQPASGELVFRLDSGRVAIARAWAPQTNRWHHLALTRGNGSYRLFVDGRPLGGEAIDLDPPARLTGWLHLGKRPSSGGEFSGAMDEISFYERGLSQAEIFALFAARGAGKCPAGPPVFVDGQPFVAGQATATNSARIEIRSGLPGGTILYSLDGSDPRLAPQVYTGPFVVRGDIVLRAVAYDELGQASEETGPLILTVRAPPTVVLSPLGRVAREGDSLLLSVRATGSLPLAYQWFTNGVALPGAIDPDVFLGNVALPQAGSYQVVVSNAFGTATSAVANLVVLAPPVILAQPSDARVGLGDTVSLQVVAGGSGPLSYQWRKNGVSLPGATSSTLTVSGVALSDGGSYTVTVNNEVGAAVGGPAALVLTNIITLQPNDAFTNRVSLGGLSGVVAGLNTGATKEAGEPDHARFQGGRSVWYSWTAPATGIARFRTTGSTFDTLLGVYTGTNVAGLSPVAHDDDLGGFLGSAVVFNASNGVAYPIAIDGFAAMSGEFVLSWELEPTDATLPEIVVPPRGVTVREGTPAVFSVLAAGRDLAYQWLFNGTEIPGAIAAAYTNQNVGAPDVGFYSVRISNGAGAIYSAPVVLEIGPSPLLQSQGKIEELLRPPPGGGGSGGGQQFPPGADLRAFQPVSEPTGFNPVLGQSAYSVIVGSTNNSGPTLSCDGRAVDDCGGFAVQSTRWLSEIVVEQPGILLLRATNNPSGRLLSVWQRPSIAVAQWCRLGCSNGEFRVVNAQETLYIIGVHSTNDTVENTRLDWIFARAPVIATNGWATNALATLGQSFSFSLTATNPIGASLASLPAEQIPPPTYQWFHRAGAQFEPLAGQTRSNLVLTAVQATDGGEYRVVASNSVGTSATNVTLVVGQPPVLNPPLADQFLRTGSVLTLTAFAESRSLVAGEVDLRLAPAYRWLSNATFLVNQTNPTLSRANVQLSGAALYSVVVSNRFGSITNSARVAVGTPPMILNPPAGQLVPLGGTIRLIVVATNGPYAGLSQPPALTYQWQFAGSPLAGLGTPLLTIPLAQLAQAGDYRVAVANPFGATTSTVARVTVHDFAVQSLLLAGETLCLTWQIVPGRTNLVQYTDSLVDPLWRDVTNPPAILNGTAQLKESIRGSPQRFYRFLAQP